MEPDSLSVESSESIRSNRHKLKEVPLKWKKKKFSTEKVMNHCNRLPRELVESPVLKILRTWLGKVLGVTYSGWLCFEWWCCSRQSPEVPSDLRNSMISWKRSLFGAGLMTSWCLFPTLFTVTFLTPIEWWYNDEFLVKCFQYEII